MRSDIWRWVLGLIYIFAVASIWVAASFVVQSVIDAGASPFFITYICNSLFVVCIPVFEIVRYFEDSSWRLRFWSNNENECQLQRVRDSEEVLLHKESDLGRKFDVSDPSIESVEIVLPDEDSNKQLDAKGRWTRTRTAKISLLLCPLWFLAYLTFNLSLKYTTVTSNTILSSTSSLFAFLISLVFLGERFTWIKLISVILCMGGTIIVSLGDMESGLSATALKPLLGDILAVVSASLYASFISLIRKKISADDEQGGRVSIAQMYGFLGLFNMLIFLPVAVLLHFTKLERFHILGWKPLGLIVAKGLLDNVLGDYLWAKAVLLTTPTVATAGLAIQVPMAAVVDAIRGHAPHLMDYLGALAIMVGFAGINIQQTENENVDAVDSYNQLPISTEATPTS
ncbi:Solute carrier family 35 member SLC35F1/F2/F6 [Macleaya cordata]|uniref:Solute carrier family 35 member SLC35F1/F2/F6 n=1 Tax=Macleaya cordata TaxID=56857 RepID=A0A200PTQ4_MACCD|nr:Solute carrier family 35 member SLC35F1/F2/F6 [Macleaya cordata]